MSEESTTAQENTRNHYTILKEPLPEEARVSFPEKKEGTAPIFIYALHAEHLLGELNLPLLRGVCDPLNTEFRSVWAGDEPLPKDEARGDLWDENCTTHDNPNCKRSHSSIPGGWDGFDRLHRYSFPGQDVQECPDCHGKTTPFWTTERVEEYVRDALEQPNGTLFIATDARRRLLGWAIVYGSTPEEKFKRSFTKKREGLYEPVHVTLVTQRTKQARAETEISARRETTRRFVFSHPSFARAIELSGSEDIEIVESETQGRMRLSIKVPITTEQENFYRANRDRIVIGRKEEQAEQIRILGGAEQRYLVIPVLEISPEDERRFREYGYPVFQNTTEYEESSVSDFLYIDTAGLGKGSRAKMFVTGSPESDIAKRLIRIFPVAIESFAAQCGYGNRVIARTHEDAENVTKILAKRLHMKPLNIYGAPKRIFYATEGMRVSLYEPDYTLDLMTTYGDPIPHVPPVFGLFYEHVLAAPSRGLQRIRETRAGVEARMREVVQGLALIIHDYTRTQTDYATPTEIAHLRKLERDLDNGDLAKEIERMASVTATGAAISATVMPFVVVPAFIGVMEAVAAYTQNETFAWVGRAAGAYEYTPALGGLSAVTRVVGFQFFGFSLRFGVQSFLRQIREINEEFPAHKREQLELRTLRHLEKTIPQIAAHARQAIADRKAGLPVKIGSMSEQESLKFLQDVDNLVDYARKRGFKTTPAEIILELERGGRYILATLRSLGITLFPFATLPDGGWLVMPVIFALDRPELFKVIAWEAKKRLPRLWNKVKGRLSRSYGREVRARITHPVATIKEVREKTWANPKLRQPAEMEDMIRQQQAQVVNFYPPHV